jgi:hypothetical protein
MRRFEYFEAGHALAGVRIGIIAPEMLSKYDGYKTYLDLIDSGKKKSEAIVLAAVQCRCNRSTIARYIYWFERDDVQNTAQHVNNESATFVTK